MKTPLTGIILAGGKSKRMGKDKAFLAIKGTTFVEHISATLKSCVETILIVGNDERLDTLDVKRVSDLVPDSGPVGGIYTGLHHSKTEYNIVLACDTPLISKEALHFLMSELDEKHDAFTVKSGGIHMPLVGIYRKSRIDHFKKAIDSHNLGLKNLLDTLHTKTIELLDAHSRSVLNINTMEDYQQLIED